MTIAGTWERRASAGSRWRPSSAAAMPETATIWQEIAGLGAGHYARIDGQGGMPVMVTPVDAELARLNTELGSTVVAAGSIEEQKATARRLDARAAMARAHGRGSRELLREGGAPRREGSGGPHPGRAGK